LSKLVIPEEKKPDLKENLSKPTTSEENKDKRPPLMDFLDIRASISGYQSFRDTADRGIISIVFFFFQFLRYYKVCCDCFFF
jgi:hypothetical protein